MSTLKFYGRIDSTRPLLAEHVPEIKAEPNKSARLNASRGEGEEQSFDVADNACLELELANGLRLWTRADDLKRDLGLASTRAAADGSFELPRTLPFGRRSRSDESDAVIAGLKVFGVNIPGKAADFIANRVERGMRDGGALCQCSPVSAAALGPATKLAGTGPTLVFLHGTASSTDGSFGGLWEAIGGNRILRLSNPGARINDLFDEYNGRILAFQHRTLTENPITNALALAEQLSTIVTGGSELHLVSHSRGGLVGELMCRGARVGAPPFDELDLGVFNGRPDTRERDELQKLGRILQEQRLSVTRFVRVACPAGGTTLADGRLDRYFSVLVNIVRQIPGLGGNPLYEALTSLLAAILQERTDPTSLPGLEAMMPISPLVKMLNRRDVQEAAELHVLGGDLAMSGFWGTLKALATDFYYRDDHDLVVNTPSMLRGAQRSKGVQYWIDTGGEVTHFNYFHRADTAAKLCDVLRGKSADQFHALTVKPFEVSSADYQKRAALEDLPIVFVVPGFMGSHLSVAGSRVWVDAADLARGRFGLLVSETATADALVGTYTALITHLAQTHEVVPFPCDWRLSFDRQAEALAAEIEKSLDSSEKSGRPIRILAHSTGGLVVRAMMASAQGSDGKPGGGSIWARMSKRPGARVLLLGTPTAGSHIAAALLMARMPLSQQISLLDLRRTEQEVLQILAGFDGLLDWLPEECLDKAWWTKFRVADGTDAHLRPDWQPPSSDRLEEARRRRDRLKGTSFDASRTLYVAGVQRSMSDELSAFLVGASGDGHGTWEAGIPSDLAATTRYAEAMPGELVTKGDLFPAFVDLLMSGTTTRLPINKPARSGAPQDGSIIKTRSVSMVPDEQELIASALGYDARTARESKQKVSVRVVHGNLARAHSPVLVGHYQYDTFVSAENYLDTQLDGRLRELHRMDLYPGKIGTAVVVANEPGKDDAGVHPGAIVAGLGVVGELTPGSLLATLEHGLTLYGSDRVGFERRRRQRNNARTARSSGAIVKIPVTALLVGSGEGGVSLADSLQAMLRAVIRANERLQPPTKDAAESGASDRLSAFIEELQIFELFEDRAIEAVHTLNQLARSAEFRDALSIEPFLARGGDGRQRASFEEQLSWWQRIRIVEESGARAGTPASRTKALKFEALTERARVDAYLAGGQRKPIEAYIARATASTTNDPVFGRTIFEMLVPLGLKERATDQRQLVLLLDPAAATIPWELMQDGFDRGARPLAVQSGMIRQLLVEQGRERIRSGYESTALVVGDPPVTDPRFPPLPGAAREAEAVRQRLSGSFSVEALIGQGADSIAVLPALHSKPWRILHIASHGVFEFTPHPDEDPVSGVVLGDDVILQASDFDQMRFVPHLVFLNCSHLGQTTPTQFHRLAANVAEQFVRMGARAVIAAGWKVDDGAAELFADTFYAEMMAGAVFGDAVQRARIVVYDRYPSSNTWGAYQCYGDPAFSLDGGVPGARTRTMVASRELCVQVDAIAAAARNGDGELADLAQSLDALVRKAAVPDWLDEPGICASLGAAYGELKQFQTAIGYYRTAAGAEKAEAHIVALEQLANLESRYAQQLAQDGSVSSALGCLDRAKTTLLHLIALSPTSERFSLLGGVHKRGAMIVTDPSARLAELTQMSEAYRQASVCNVARRLKDPWYPLMNCLVGLIACSWQHEVEDQPLKDDIVKDLEAVRGRAVDLRAAGATSFWELVFLVDTRLMTVLVRGQLSTRRDRLSAAYRAASRRGASAREMDSVINQLRFLQQMALTRMTFVADDLGRLADSLRR
jgi:hypothetical protein